MNDPRVEVVPVDVTRVEECADKIRGYDVLMNATYFGFFDAAIRAACHAGVNYADLISEPSAEQTALVRQSGITAVSGLGCTPGLSNVLAQDGVSKFDQTEIHIQWRLPEPLLLGGPPRHDHLGIGERVSHATVLPEWAVHRGAALPRVQGGSLCRATRRAK
jgi:hypothetical protein